jgi:serine/threonine protein kinase
LPSNSDVPRVTENRDVQLVGRYRLVELIGEGAMAKVYRAHDPSIDREIAIKILKAELCRNDEIKTRFLREARTAGALSHPGIVTIHDVGEAQGHPYIAMELLEGEPLSDRIIRLGKIPVGTALELGKQIAAALHYAHSIGVVHRDIKPSNVMLCEAGQVAKILDFGIAHISEADRMRAELASISTQLGQVLGTPRYMSPEQALGAEIDHRSDLFSLGAVIYEMIVGKPAFDGSSFATIAIQVVRDKPVPLRSSSQNCPPSVQPIIERLLAKDPADRFKSGAEVADALERERRRLERKPRRRILPLEVRRTAVVSFVTAALLALPIGIVVKREEVLLNRTAITSGNSIASFVAANAALLAADNFSLPEAEQDWLPVQAFVRSAAKDPAIRDIVVSDARGIVRGSIANGKIDHPPAAKSPGASVDEGVHIRRDITYAGHPFGHVDVILDQNNLDRTSASSRNLMIELGIAIWLLVTAMTYFVARSLIAPLRQLNRLIGKTGDAAPFRMVHKRSDEFGQLFDRINDLVTSSASATTVSRRTKTEANATRIEPSASVLLSSSKMRA